MMRAHIISTGIRILAVTVAAAAGIAGICFAQGTNPNFVTGKEAQQEQDQQLKERQMQQNGQPPAPKVDPAEEAAYKAFYDAGSQPPDVRIQLGNDFLQKYPMSRYLESVYGALVQSYYAKQDWKNFYDYADKTLAINADNVTVLTIVGWVIPHVFNPSDPEAQRNLDKAERYDKHAIEVIGALPKPVGLTDDQFAQSKAAILSEAHSGLGLVYFRRQQASESVTELQQATQAAANPDPTDYYVLGLDLNTLKRFPEAADAFNKCSQISGGLQDRCKQSADDAKKQAAQPR
jgi:tetratricopeptide (TPR) repeat protein